jgi:hypothetical protein
MSENQNGFLPPEKIKMAISMKLTEKYGNYQEAINALKNLYVGRDNLPQVQQVLKNINAMLSSVEDHRKEMKEPFLEQGRLVDTEHKEFIAPIVQAKDVIQKKANEIGKMLADEAAKEQAEKQKKAAIETAINTFIIDFSLKIAAATTNEQLISIERLINLEKANKSKYGDQLPLLIERCNELNALLASQKVLVKEKEALEQAKKQAEIEGDDDKLEELEKKSEQIEEKIQDKAFEVQSMASNNIILSDTAGENDVNAPKARRTVWKAELVDEKEAIKKAKDMLDITLNAEKARQSINTLKSAGVFTGKDEVIINGIRYYQEKTF